MTEIAIRSASIPDKLNYAESLANSGLLPKQYFRNPANVLYAIEYGETIGITAMAAITGVHVIEGKPSASAALISGLVRRAGHKLRVTGDNQSATAQIIRADDPDYTFSFTYTIQDAHRAGLTGKGVWKSYPAAMLRARAITQVARDACEEILFGLHYTPEELGADVDAEGEPVEQRAQRHRAQTADDPWATTAPAAAATTEYADVVEDRPAPEPATPEQINAILKSLSARAVNSRDQARAIIAEAAGREIGGPGDLTAAEAEAVLEKLTEQNAAIEAQEAAAEPEAPPAEPKPKTASGAQLTALNTGLGKIGITERNARIAWAAEQVGRPLGSTKDLTRDEISRLIDVLHDAPPPAPDLTDDLAAQMRAAATSDELADVSEEMWRHHEAGRLSEAEISRLQDQSLARESELAAVRTAAA